MRKTITALLLVPGLLLAGVSAAQAPIADDAPDRYVVKKGDTLWHISGRFLKDPWRWPELWGMNRDDVRNPHLIYPGDVLVLDRLGGGMGRLRVDTSVVKLSPQVRAEEIRKAITSIPADAIEQFLTLPLVTEPGALDGAPHIVGTPDSRVILSSGDLAYVDGLQEGKGLHWQIYRTGRPLVDPETNETLGVEANYLGTARVVRYGPVSTVEIAKSKEEIVRGDRLVVLDEDPFKAYIPRAPEKQITGRIIAAHGGVSEVGTGSVVVINRGKRDGLEIGHVLETRPLIIEGGKAPRDAKVELPSERSGLVFVFRVFDRVSYAVLVRAKRQVAVMDFVKNP